MEIIESEVEDKRIDCTVIVNGELESIIVYVNENATNNEIIESLHEVALLKFGKYDELKFEKED